MAYVLIEHLVGDFEVFTKVYLDDEERREAAGCRRGRVFRSDANANNVIVLLEFDTLELARDFAGSLELKQSIPWSTSTIATPRVVVLADAMDSGA